MWKFTVDILHDIIIFNEFPDVGTWGFVHFSKVSLSLSKSVCQMGKINPMWTKHDDILKVVKIIMAISGMHSQGSIWEIEIC